MGRRRGARSNELDLVSAIYVGTTYRDELRMRLFAVDQRLTHCVSLCVGHEGSLSCLGS